MSLQKCYLCSRVIYWSIILIMATVTFHANLINHRSMNWDQFKDPLCYLCLPDAVVAWWFHTQEITYSNTLLFFFTKTFLAKYILNTTSVDSVYSTKFISGKLEWTRNYDVTSSYALRINIRLLSCPCAFGFLHNFLKMEEQLLSKITRISMCFRYGTSLYFENNSTWI